MYNYEVRQSQIVKVPKLISMEAVMIAVIEQTYDYKKRMEYQPDTQTFVESESDCLHYVRGFQFPYGWIKESGTPPEPHWDVYIMSDQHFKLGDEIPVKIIGVFERNDGDYKFVAVEEQRNINELDQLSMEETKALHLLYPRIKPGEGWFGRSRAMELYMTSEKAL